VLRRRIALCVACLWIAAAESVLAQAPLTQGETIRVHWQRGTESWSGVGELLDTEAVGLFRGAVRDTLLVEIDGRLERMPLRVVTSVERPLGRRSLDPKDVLIVGPMAGFAAGFGLGALVQYGARDKTPLGTRTVTEAGLSVGTFGAVSGVLLAVLLGNRMHYDNIPLETLRSSISVRPHTEGVRLNFRFPARDP